MREKRLKDALRRLPGRSTARRTLNLRTVTQFNAQALAFFGQEDSLQRVMQTLQDTLKLSYAALWLYEDERNSFVLSKTVGNFPDQGVFPGEGSVPDSGVFPEKGVFPDLLPGTLPVPSESALCPEKPQRLRGGAALPPVLIPLRGLTGLELAVCLLAPGTEKPLGLLALGQRPAGAFFAEQDLEIIALLAQQVACLCQSARMWAGRKQAHEWALGIAEAERRRLWCELHDSVLPSLGGQGKLLETIDRKMNGAYNPAEIQHLIQECTDEIYKAAQDLRHCFRNLPEDPGLEALKRAVDEFQHNSGLNVQHQITLPREVKLSEYQLYHLDHLLHQALDYLGAHARAQAVRVEIGCQGGEVRFVIQAQTGDRQAPDPLPCLQQDVRELNGQLSLRVEAGQGLTIQGAFPC